MAHRTRRSIFIMALFIPALLAGCGSVRETLPPRSAMEQLLISTAADRAIDSLLTEWMSDRAIFVETSNLECYDKPYVVERIRQTIVENNGRIVEDAKEAEVILEVASGALSVNTRDYLIGLPAMPLPIPFAGETLKTPELALLKAVFYRSKAKLAFTAVDAASRGLFCELPDCLSEASAAFWWVLLCGPFEVSDLPFKRQ